MTSRPGSVYIHFPWCLAKCPYCDFLSYGAPRESIDHAGYADAVVRELDARASSFESEGGELTIESVFFGGGTPSLWDTAHLGRVLSAVRGRLRCSEDLEVTVECNPTSLDEAKARALVGVGVNRLSIGTQSLKGDQLAFLGRLHDEAGARAAIRGALASGVPRLSTDLIFGLPGQAPEDAAGQACELAALGLRHLSCYQLTIEPGTPFGALARRGRLPRADDGIVADAFVAIDEALLSRGLLHYEISNYAHTGEEARHNLGYWRGGEYIGLGCGAWGFARRRPTVPGATGGVTGVRYRNHPDPARYVEGARVVRGDALGVGDGLSVAEDRLDGEALLRERIMLGLRLIDGVDLEAAARDLGVLPWTAARERERDQLLARGRLVCSGGRLRIPPAGWLWTDDTAARLF